MKPTTTDRQGQITTREELIYALCRAAEVEHGLICIYLFAAFSVKSFLEEGIDEARRLGRGRTELFCPQNSSDRPEFRPAEIIRRCRWSSCAAGEAGRKTIRDFADDGC
jgi:hypothetical protein